MALSEQLNQFPVARATAGGATVAFREALSAGYSGPVSHVLLHGIGSASASWLAQLLQAASPAAVPCRLLAWDAPGYGDSDKLPALQPDADAYARRLWDWLDALGSAAGQPLTLVGHSLGALMAARAAVSRPQRVARLVLLAPAPGYARAEASIRERKLSERLSSLAELGPAGLASKRAGAMLSAQASTEQRLFVEQVMAGIRPDGYTQAAHMLAGGDLQHDLAQLRCARVIASGSADGVTPVKGCAALAQALGIPYLSLGAVGHMCTLEAAAAVNHLLGISGEPA